MCSPRASLRPASLLLFIARTLLAALAPQTSRTGLRRVTHVRRTRSMRKMECMIQYHLARMPLYGAHESPQYARAQGLRDDIKKIEVKAKQRWENGHV